MQVPLQSTSVIATDRNKINKTVHITTWHFIESQHVQREQLSSQHEQLSLKHVQLSLQLH